MCGICGVKGGVNEALLRRMTQIMVHRGPDDEGLYLDEHAGLGVRRLSIIDLAGGHQPISNEDGTLWVVFNGEIYNHRELRRRLESQGHRFTTRSDTEVLVHLHEEYGDAAVHLLQGMFAYALWDRRRRRMLLVRDRLGIKPLYYAEVGGNLLFASEVKALLCHVALDPQPDLEALDLYLAFRYVPGPRTLFRGVRKLPPGHLLVAQDGSIQVRRYWELVLGDFQPDTSVEEAAEEFRGLFHDTVQQHLISDVPVGILLSGGMDSSSVLAMAADSGRDGIDTFTVGFDLPGTHNELAEARLVSRHFSTRHHELLLKPDVAALLPDLLWHLDEPVADPAALPTYLICRFARQTVSVVLTGEGGDELLAGYPRYSWFVIAKRLQQLLPAWVREGVILPLARLAPIGHRYKTALDNVLAERDDISRHLRWICGLDPSPKRNILSPGLREAMRPGAAEAILAPYLRSTDHGSREVIHRLMALDMATWLVDDILTKMDKMSMAASVEARVPFLDHRLVEFAASLPLEVKVKSLGSKLLLKRAVQSLLPAATIRRRKHAFQVPVGQWVSGPLQGFVRETLLSRQARQRGWFAVKPLEALLAATPANGTRYGQSIWTLLCLELWARAFLDGEATRAPT